MANEHDFDITIVDERTFSLTTGTESDLSDSHTFASILATAARLFNVIIDNMVTITSWAANFIQSIVITATMIMTQALEVEIKLWRIAIDAVLSMTQKLTDEIKLKRILITAVMQQTLGLPITVKLYRFVITAVATIYWSLGDVTITIPKIALAATIWTGEFYPLWLYDGTALWTMDGETLGDLDFSTA